jgi:hypothetical protein
MGHLVTAFILRTGDFLLRWPYRLWKMICWLLWIDRPFGKHLIARWLAGLFFSLTDLIPVALLLETIGDIIKPNTRSLHEAEKQLATAIFGQSVPLRLVGMDGRSWLARKKKTIAFVGWHTVHFDQSLPDFTFIHELMHIWQYHKWGSRYISEAIHAQRWGGGYDYGGKPALIRNKDIGLVAFNAEQQADLIEDYFRAKNGLALQWGTMDAEMMSLLERYRENLHQ